MSEQYSNSYKNCARCNYWGGTRQVDTFGERVTVDSSMARAKCLLQGGPWRGQERQANSGCEKWQSWGALK